MFADSDWIADRIQGEEAITIRMEHLKWRPMKLVFQYIHQGEEENLFDYLHQETLDEFLDFVLEVLAAAVSDIDIDASLRLTIQTELLLDRLVLVCSRVIVQHCNAYNASALACEANFYQATTLKLSIFDYIISCMETMLESGLLDDLDEETLADLVKVITEKQSKKLSVSRSGILVKQAMEKHRDWFAVQDFPVPKVRQPFRWRPKSPVLSPVEPFTYTPAKSRKSPSPASSPILQAISANSAIDDIFSMDEESSPITSSTKTSRPVTPLDLSAKSGPVWRSNAVEAQK